ncbi:MAG: LysM peptidoglycan-binding domain-containing protein [Alphaproteobacteria bacterium]|nr:LysM peptidoglycan-binding domain-containing protein [Alphaproteobacteria bacterium]
MMMLATLAWVGLAQASDHHVLRAGETLESVAAAQGVDPVALRELNGLSPEDQPEVGAVLKLPGAPGERPEPAVLHTFLGTGYVQPPRRDRSPLEPALPLTEGTTLCTHAESYATLRLAVDVDTGEHDDVNLWPETCVVVESLSSKRGGRSSLLRVLNGSISVVSTRPGESEGRITLRTADAVATADGGGQRLHVEEGATRAEAVYKPMAVIAQGEELALEAGQGSRVRAGEAPGPVVQLLLPGESLTPRPSVSLRVPAFRWGPVAEAAAYQIELGMDPEFREVVLMQSLPDPRWDPQVLVVPYRESGFWWRTCAYDSLGFLGIPSEPRALKFPEGVAP